MITVQWSCWKNWESSISLKYPVFILWLLEFQKIKRERISLRECRKTLVSSEATAPGADLTMYEILKQLPEAAKKFLRLLRWFGDWYFNQKVENFHHSSWKKNNKDALQAISCRPIVFTNRVCKEMEKMKNNRLVWYLETKGLIFSYQLCFRRNWSTLDTLLRPSKDLPNNARP